MLLVLHKRLNKYGMVKNILSEPSKGTVRCRGVTPGYPGPGSPPGGPARQSRPAARPARTPRRPNLARSPAQ